MRHVRKGSSANQDQSAFVLLTTRVSGPTLCCARERCIAGSLGMAAAQPNLPGEPMPSAKIFAGPTVRSIIVYSAKQKDAVRKSRAVAYQFLLQVQLTSTEIKIPQSIHHNHIASQGPDSHILQVSHNQTVGTCKKLIRNKQHGWFES